MDFFESQDAAHRTTRRLVYFYVATIICIVLCVYISVAVGLVCIGTLAGTPWSQIWSGAWQWRGDLFALVVLCTLALVVGGTVYKSMQLRDGGRDIAESLGGSHIDPATTDSIERRIHNVVEEMAIASGTPVPGVYFLGEETGINAFAAGFTPTDAVIGITRGAAEALTRDELQGVVAHEFSHILNGDMRLNTLLVSTLHGITLIGNTGLAVLRLGGYGSSGSSRRRRRSRGGIDARVTLAIFGIGAEQPRSGCDRTPRCFSRRLPAWAGSATRWDAPSPPARAQSESEI